MAQQNAPTGEIIIYQAEDGKTRVECRYVDDSLWLTQSLMSELFGVSIPAINEHLSNLYREREINPEATLRKFRIVRREGARDVSRLIDHYNLDAILAVGFRVRGLRGGQFRRWASETLKEFMVKGFVLDDARLKNPPQAGLDVSDHFDELLERIRDIRASEARMYLRIRDIFSLAADYQLDPKQTALFFQHMQNKLHFTVTGMTAAELVTARASRHLPNMGLQTLKGKSVTKAEVTIAKNYLTLDEISELNRIVVMWLDFAEDQARRRKQIFMDQWQEKLDDFLKFNDRAILTHPGKVTHEQAVIHARQEYETFSTMRRALKEAEGEKALEHSIEQATHHLHSKPQPKAKPALKTDKKP
jgi:hypothetical protein